MSRVNLGHRDNEHKRTIPMHAQLSLAEDAAAREREAAAAQLATTEGALARTAGEEHAAARREVEVSNGATAASGQLERERERDGAGRIFGVLRF